MLGFLAICYGCAVLASSSSESSPILHTHGIMRDVFIGSFVSFKQFKRYIPLETLLVERQNLFRDKNGFDHLAALQGDLKHPDRLTTARHFLAHDSINIDEALKQVLTFSNDLSVAAAIACPKLYVTRSMMAPITQLIKNYRAALSTPSLLRYLPDAFHEASLYNAFFQLDESINYEPSTVPGILALYPRSQTYFDLIEDKVICNSDTSKANQVFVDIAQGKALRVRRPFLNVIIIPSMRALFAIDSDSNQLFAWRGESMIIIPVPSLQFALSLSPDAKYAHVECSDSGNNSFKFSMDSSVPFAFEVVTKTLHRYFLTPMQWLSCADGFVLFRNHEAVMEFRELQSFMATALEQEVDSPFRSIQQRISSRQKALVAEALKIYHESGLASLVANAMENQRGQIFQVLPAILTAASL